MAEQIKFLACNPTLGKFPQVDGGGTVILHFSQDEYIKIIKLPLLQDKQLRVTIDEVEE